MKQCYMSHRRFLPMDHPWRHDRKNFNGDKELEEKPPQLSGDDTLEQLCAYEQEIEKLGVGRKFQGMIGSAIGRKRASFFKLPY